MKVFSLVLVLIASIAIARANIGETPAQVETRYGKSFGEVPTPTFGTMSGYLPSGLVVGVKFVDGVSEMEMFSKTDQADMSASEIDKLLKTNSDGTWKAEITGKPNWRRWRRDDGTSVALYDAARHFLYINSAKYYEAKGQQIEQQEWSAQQQGNPASQSGAKPTASP